MPRDRRREYALEPLLVLGGRLRTARAVAVALFLVGTATFSKPSIAAVSSPTLTSIEAEQTATPTATPTANQSPVVARGKAEPNPARPGQVVELLDDGSTGESARRLWFQKGLPRASLTPSGEGFSFIAPRVTQPTSLLFVYRVCDASKCSHDMVNVRIVPCNGDCNGDGSIAVSELVTLVNLALGTPESTRCGELEDGIRIADVVSAVVQSLNDCESAGNFTPERGSPEP